VRWAHQGLEAVGEAGGVGDVGEGQHGVVDLHALAHGGRRQRGGGGGEGHLDATLPQRRSWRQGDERGGSQAGDTSAKRHVGWYAQEYYINTPVSSLSARNCSQSGFSGHASGAHPCRLLQ
jgi:hypothetical protein